MKKVLLLCVIFALSISCLFSCNLFHTHKYGKIIIIKDATCTESGESARYCSCGEVIKKTIALKDHSYKYGRCQQCGTTQPSGLYMTDGRLIVSWDDLTKTYVMYIAKNYTLENYQTLATSAYFVFKSFDYQLRYGSVLVIDNKETVIGDYSLCSCDNLESVIIPDSVTTVGECAFAFCSKLTSVVIGGGVSTLGKDAFIGCNELTYVEIADGMTTIGESAFSYCNKLTTIILPNSITTISDGAFNIEGTISDVYYTGTEAEWAEIYIGSANEALTEATIHYNYIPE